MYLNLYSIIIKTLRDRKTFTMSSSKHPRLRNILVYMCLFISNHYGNASDVAQSNKKIIIIGAGPAGIAAASKLFENGFNNVMILEAENRIGGRLYTTKLGNYSVDLGGQWVVGEKDNVVFNLAYPLGLLDNSTVRMGDGQIRDSSGNLVNSIISDNMEYFVEKYSIGASSDKINASASSLGEFIRQAYDEEFKNVSEMMDHKDEILYHLEVLQLSEDSADSWDDISTANGFTVLEGSIAVNWKSGGYGNILDVLMKRYPNPEDELPVLNNTLLNTEVTSINYKDSEKGQPIFITTKDNRTFEADHVIVTVSLGVLKAQHESLFVPPLPDKKVDAIKTLGFGGAGKVYLLFEEPFWQDGDKVTYFSFLWNDADIKAIEDDPEQMWVLGVTGAWPVEHKSNLLEFYISSKWAKAMEVVPENKVYNQTLELLERFLGKIYKIPKPIAMMRTQWCTNPHFRGTYSYPNIESEKKHIHWSDLQESITSENPRVLFAGEATSLHRYGNADGAIQSGWTAAESLINFYKMTPSQKQK